MNKLLLIAPLLLIGCDWLPEVGRQEGQDAGAPFVSGDLVGGGGSSEDRLRDLADPSEGTTDEATEQVEDEDPGQGSNGGEVTEAEGAGEGAPWLRLYAYAGGDLTPERRCLFNHDGEILEALARDGLEVYDSEGALMWESYLEGFEGLLCHDLDGDDEIELIGYGPERVVVFSLDSSTPWTSEGLELGRLKQVRARDEALYLADHEGRAMLLRFETLRAPIPVMLPQSTRAGSALLMSPNDVLRSTASGFERINVNGEGPWEIDLGATPQHGARRFAQEGLILTPVGTTLIALDDELDLVWSVELDGYLGPIVEPVRLYGRRHVAVTLYPRGGDDWETAVITLDGTLLARAPGLLQGVVDLNGDDDDELLVNLHSDWATPGDLQVLRLPFEAPITTLYTIPNTRLCHRPLRENPEVTRELYAGLTLTRGAPLAVILDADNAQLIRLGEAGAEASRPYPSAPRSVLTHGEIISVSTQEGALERLEPEVLTHLSTQRANAYGPSELLETEAGVCVLNHRGVFGCLDPHTQGYAWSRPFMNGPMAYSGGVAVVFDIRRNELVCLDTETGEELCEGEGGVPYTLLGLGDGGFLRLDRLGRDNWGLMAFDAEGERWSREWSRAATPRAGLSRTESGRIFVTLGAVLIELNAAGEFVQERAVDSARRGGEVLEAEGRLWLVGGGVGPEVLHCDDLSLYARFYEAEDLLWDNAQVARVGSALWISVSTERGVARVLRYDLARATELAPLYEDVERLWAFGDAFLLGFEGRFEVFDVEGQRRWGSEEFGVTSALPGGLLADGEGRVWKTLAP